MKYLQFLYFVESKEKAKNVESFIDASGMTLFFKKESDIYGATEDARVTFAHMKNDKSCKDASFMAINLKKLVQGEQSTSVFQYEDLKKIDVISKKELVKELANIDKEKIPNNFIQTMEQK